MTNVFVFDTYAIMEIINGNNAYNLYINAGLIINEFIFAELCYKLFREKVNGAENYLLRFAPYILKVEPSVIKEAMLFRIKNKKKNLSMTDCISYFMAKAIGIKFLTGDKEFLGLSGIEFIK